MCSSDLPQDDCTQGLNMPKLLGKDEEITNWFNAELDLLNKKYFAKLSKAKKTSNILMVIKK